MLDIRNLTFTYPGRRQVLSDFSLSFPAGGVYGLLGLNGAGKSTLLYLIAGLLTPDSGEVTFNGVNTRLRRATTLADIFIVPEEFDLPSIRLHEYIKVNAPFYPKFSYSDLEKHLGTFDMGRADDVHLGRLSMGQKKKVFMSFALACNTRLLLMDEPTNGLDIPGKVAFRRFIASEAGDDRTIIISTHQVRDVESLLDHVVIMNNREVLLDTSVAEINAHLKFFNTSDPAEIGRSLYNVPSLGGATVVTVNDDGNDTDINLESLFGLTLNRPDMVKTMFSRPKTDRKDDIDI